MYAILAMPELTGNDLSTTTLSVLGSLNDSGYQNRPTDLAVYTPTNRVMLRILTKIEDLNGCSVHLQASRYGSQCRELVCGSFTLSSSAIDYRASVCSQHKVVPLEDSHLRTSTWTCVAERSGLGQLWLVKARSLRHGSCLHQGTLSY